MAEIIAEMVSEAYGLSLPATTESVEQGPSTRTDVAEVRHEVRALKAEFHELCLTTKADVRAEFARPKSDLIHWRGIQSLVTSVLTALLTVTLIKLLV